MRKKTVSQASLFDQAVHQLISLIKPEKALMDMNKILDENPDILQCIHEDLADKKKNTGSKGISAEFRNAQVEGNSQAIVKLYVQPELIYAFFYRN